MAGMNGYQRITAALRGDRPDTTPVMLHNFLMAAREAGISMAAYRSKPQKIAETHIRAVETYGYDGVTVDVDTATLAGAVGVPVDFPEDDPARVHEPCLRDLEAVNNLAPIDISKNARVQIWLEGARLLKQHFGDEIFVRGNCDQCPFGLASMMRTPEEWMVDIMDPDSEELVFKLLAFCTDITGQFVRLMAQTGVHMASNGDSPAGPDMISPGMYRKFALPYEQQIVDIAHAAGTPYLLHICGNTNSIIEDMASLGADALELDYKTDIHRIHNLLKNRTAFVGNIDPSSVLALGTPQLVEEKTRELLELYRDSPRFILNAGCAIPSTTPAENLATMIRVAREY